VEGRPAGVVLLHCRSGGHQQRIRWHMVHLLALMSLVFCCRCCHTRRLCLSCVLLFLLLGQCYKQRG
jgi:hypothetical protein